MSRLLTVLEGFLFFTLGVLMHQCSGHHSGHATEGTTENDITSAVLTVTAGVYNSTNPGTCWHAVIIRNAPGKIASITAVWAMTSARPAPLMMNFSDALLY